MSNLAIAESKLPVTINESVAHSLPSKMLTDMALQTGGSTIDEQIDAMQQHMLQLPQVQCDVLHRFAPGLYIRELSLPAGTLVVGHHHRDEHLNVLLKGKVTLLNDDGTTSTLQGPMMFVAKPGRKVAYIEEDMVWQNIYATTETDVEKLEEQLLDKDAIWHQHLEYAKHKLLPRADDRQDYSAMLDEFGITEEQVTAEALRDDNVIPMPYGTYKFKIGDSPINGKGIFATAHIKAGDVIGPARIDDQRTILGRYTNHSPMPNAYPVRREGRNVDFVALHDITGCQGGMDGEEITVDYRQCLKIVIEINQEK